MRSDSKIYARLAALFIATALLVSCATTSTGGSQEKRAQAQAQEGQHADAAASYIGLASSKEGSERDRLTLLAVQQWLDAGDGRRARSALREVRKPSSGELLWLWNTDVAALYLYEGRPDDALNLLEPMSSQPLTQQYRIIAEALRADAYFQLDDPTRATQLYLQRENWLQSNLDLERNRQRLWAGLLVSNPQSMRAAANVSADPIISGWLSLGALAAATGQQGIGWGNGVVSWQSANAGHPAQLILDNMILPEGRDLDFPLKVALLLPVSGKNATAGQAVQNGFFGGYFASAAGLPEAQSVTVYDVASVSVVDAYQQAVSDGAEFVVGPLLRRDVQQLANLPILNVPVLALNYLDDSLIAPPGFFQFALAPEDEAASAAARALADGSVNAVALYPNNDWGRRVMNSFSSELEANGGTLLDHNSYETGMQDFSLEIESLMGLSQSVNRYSRLRANLGEPLQFDPRRRQDVNFVFLAADGKVGRLIKSQLKFHYAGELPVYSTSFIYSMDGRSDRDLNGIMFADAPWVIAPPAWIADYPNMYGEFWPAERRMGRLHAMGYDAYNLVSRLFGGNPTQQLEMSGATGRLYLDDDGKVHRHLAWAQFERGEPVALPEIEVFDDALQQDVPEEDELFDTPVEWRIQQLNQ